MKSVTIPNEIIENRIFLIRGKKVMFDRDLARLYGVETKKLNQAVKRNKTRFPEDFMFQLTRAEADYFSRSQIVTLNRGQKYKVSALCFHRTRRCDAFIGSEKRAGDSGEHPNYAHIHKNPQNDRQQQSSSRKNRGDGAKI